jgi:hypothetical protein
MREKSTDAPGVPLARRCAERGATEATAAGAILSADPCAAELFGTVVVIIGVPAAPRDKPK